MDDRAAIGILHSTWVKKLRDGDLAGLVDLVTEDAVFWGGSAPEIAGRAGVLQAFETPLASYTIEQQWKSEELIISPPWALDRGLETVVLSQRGSDAPPVTSVRRAFVFLHRDDDGRWRYARGMSCPMSQAT